MTQQTKGRGLTNLFVAAKLFDGGLILLASIIAFLLRGTVKRISDSEIGPPAFMYAIIPLKKGATGAEQMEQVRKITWNNLSSKIDTVYTIAYKRSFIDKYSDHPSLF